MADEIRQRNQSPVIPKTEIHIPNSFFLEERSVTEITSIIRELKAKKSPGIDVITEYLEGVVNKIAVPFALYFLLTEIYFQMH